MTIRTTSMKTSMKRRSMAALAVLGMVVLALLGMVVLPVAACGQGAGDGDAGGEAAVEDNARDAEVVVAPAAAGATPCSAA
jgi:hypothetical protein